MLVDLSMNFFIQHYSLDVLFCTAFVDVKHGK